MRYILLIPIALYWKIIPVNRRRRCIYRCSCSRYVYDQAKMLGIIEGVRALLNRARRCNGNAQLFRNPVTGDLELILTTGDVLTSNEIAERLLVGFVNPVF